jgi:acetyl esterase/lipase
VCPRWSGARFASGEELAARALGERVRPHVAEGLVGGAERLAGVGAPVLAPKPLPVRASDEMLAALPPALLIVDEADVLRDEGEAYASRLREAGVAVTTVRYDGITHDFMMLNPLSETQATRAAVAQVIATLRQALHAA